MPCATASTRGNIRRATRLWPKITRPSGFSRCKHAASAAKRGTIVPRHGTLPHHARADDAQKDKMEIEIAFKALAFFAAFMAGRSLTAYFKKSNSAAKRGTMAA